MSPFPPDRDGIGDYSATLVGELERRGCEVSLARPSEIGARDRAAEWRPDVVHVQFAVAAFGRHIPALVREMGRAQRAGVPVVLTAHEVTRDTARLRMVGRQIYRRICGLADHVIVHTDAAQTAMTDAIGVVETGVSVISMPQPPTRAPTTDAAELRERHALGHSPVILAFGFIHCEKGLDTIVEALGRVRRDATDLDDARLVIAGTVRRRSAIFRPFEWRDRAHLRKVRRLIRQNGLVDRVDFVGYVPDGEVGPWFDVGEALVLAYRRVEQSGVGSLARASQVPIIASDAGCLATDFSDPARTFPVGDAPALADRIATLLRAAPRSRATNPDYVQGPGRSVAAVAEDTLCVYRRFQPIDAEANSRTGHEPDGTDRDAHPGRARQAFGVRRSG